MFLVLALLAIAGSIIGRYIHEKPTTVAPLVDELTYPGFQTFPTPRTFDPPGTVFRIDRSGRKFLVTQLTVTIESGTEALASYAKTDDWNFAALVSYLTGRNSEDLDVSSSVKVRVLLGPGLRETTSDLAIDQLLAVTNISFRDGNKYFLIRETISVLAITYDFSGSGEFSGKGREIMNRVVHGHQGLSWRDSSSSALVEKFDQPHRIFFNADELLAPGLGSGESKLQRAPAQYSVKWIAETLPH